MKTFAGLVVTFFLVGTASAEAPMSRSDLMRACAAQWKAHGHHSHGMRYQHFIRECLKKTAAKG